LEESIFFPTTDRPRKTEQIVIVFNTRQFNRMHWRFTRVSLAPGREERPFV
jgi:uncharacterized heparinase superfamily protein